MDQVIMTEEELLKIQDELFANLDSQEQFKEQGAKEQYLNSIEEDISKELLKNYEGIPPEAYFNAVKEQYQEAKGIEEDEITKGIDKLIDIAEYAKEQKKSEQKPEHNIENNVAPEISNEQIAEENKEVGKGTEENLSKEDYINLLEKETAADLVLNINDSNEYKEFKKNNPEEEIGITDYLNSLKNQTNNKAQKEGIENIEKQIKISFPDSKGTKLTADAEKQKLDCALIRINDSKEYKEYKKEALERGEKVNEWSYLKKQLSSPHISPEEANKIEKTISLIEKHKPELVNILQNTEKKEQELSPIRKALLEQFKNDPNITANGEKIAQDILNSLFTPLKIAEKYIKNQQIQNSQKEIESKRFQVYVNQQLYYVQGYSADFSHVNLKNAETGKSLSVPNNTTLKITADKDNIKISAAQKDLLKQGKTLIIGQDTKQPMICSMKQGELTFKNLDTNTYKKNILKEEKSLGQKVKSKLKIGM